MLKRINVFKFQLYAIAMEKEFVVHLGDFGEHSLLEFDADLLIEALLQSSDEELRLLAEVLVEMFKKDHVIEANIYDSSVHKGKKVRIQRLQYLLEQLIENKSLFSFYCNRCDKRHDGKELKIFRYKFDQGKEYNCPRGHYIWNVTHETSQK
jgi:hypothetical protein